MPAEGAHAAERRGPDHGPGVIQLTFPSTPLSVRRGLEAVRAALQPLPMDPEELGTIELVLAEALNNIVEHAYEDTQNGWIKLDCHCQADGLHVTIRDEGREMPDGAPPIGKRAPLPQELDAMPEGGFGWFLIRDLSRDVRYHRKDGVNTLSFRINIDLPVAGA